MTRLVTYVHVQLLIEQTLNIATVMVHAKRLATQNRARVLNVSVIKAGPDPNVTNVPMAGLEITVNTGEKW